MTSGSFSEFVQWMKWWLNWDWCFHAASRWNNFTVMMTMWSDGANPSSPSSLQRTTLDDRWSVSSIVVFYITASEDVTLESIYSEQLTHSCMLLYRRSTGPSGEKLNTHARTSCPLMVWWQRCSLYPGGLRTVRLFILVKW